MIDDPDRATAAFQSVSSAHFKGEPELIEFLESAHGVLDDFSGEALANEYFNLLSAFLDKFSLRYELRRPCTLCPTLPGVFSSLLRELRDTVAGDSHLDGLMRDFDDAVRDLRAGATESRIKTCIQKEINLLEALGTRAPGVTGNTLGAICNQLNSWPHAEVQESLKRLYRFTCDYPGIRHGGTPASALRPIDSRDMVAIAILLVGYTPYLSAQVDSKVVYGG